MQQVEAPEVVEPSIRGEEAWLEIHLVEVAAGLQGVFRRRQCTGENAQYTVLKVWKRAPTLMLSSRAGGAFMGESLLEQ